MDTADYILKLLDTYGLPVVALVMAGIFLMKAGRYIGIRLFDKNEGLITRVAERIIQFIDKTSATQESIAKTQNALADSAKLAHEGMKERNELVKGVADKTEALHRMARHYCDLTEAACTQLGPEVKNAVEPYIKAIRHELNS